MNGAWDLHGLLRSVRTALEEEALRRDADDAPTGLDALDELSMHEIVRAGLAGADVGVLSEQRYPGDRSRRRRSEGERCDIALTPRPGAAIEDPLADPGLFGAGAIPPEEALWIEVKLARQFVVIEGEARPDRGYSSQLLQSATADVRKLGADPRIRTGAAMLIMFGVEAGVLEHDLDVWCNRCLTKGLDISPPIVESFPIRDRIGNGVCQAALIEVHARLSG